MSKLYDAYATSKDAEANGIWVSEPGGRFKLARMGGANTKYQRALTAAMKPYMREMQLGLLDEATVEPIMRKVFLDTILLDWEIEADDDGTPGPAFNVDNATKLFADLPDLYAALREKAGSYANYRAASIQDAAKN